MIDIFYLAKPRFGGWISFTAHLALKHNFEIFKITKKGEKKKEILDMIQNIKMLILQHLTLINQF